MSVDESSNIQNSESLKPAHWMFQSVSNILTNKLITFFDGHNDTFRKTRDNLLRWLVGLKPIQLEQQKTQFLLIILAKKNRVNTLQSHKKYLKIFELEINNLRIQILLAKMT